MTKKTKQSKQQKVQAVHITLTNGQKGVFLGEVLVEEEDVKTLGIQTIEFTPPAPLPDGYTMEITNLDLRGSKKKEARVRLRKKRKKK